MTRAMMTNTEGDGFMIDPKTECGAVVLISSRRAALVLSVLLIAPGAIAMAQPPQDQKADPGTSVAHSITINNRSR